MRASLGQRKSQVASMLKTFQCSISSKEPPSTHIFILASQNLDLRVFSDAFLYDSLQLNVPYAISFSWLYDQTNSPSQAVEGTVDFMGCSYINAEWRKKVNGDGNLVIKGGHCRSITQGCCQSTACAPKQIDVILKPADIRDLVWFKVTEECLSRSMGAIHMNDGWDYMVMTARPPRCMPKGHRPDWKSHSQKNELHLEN